MEWPNLCGFCPAKQQLPYKTNLVFRVKLVVLLAALKLVQPRIVL